MTLSIVIVNYNVKFFLKQCLNSVVRSIQDLNAEIIVIDNHSSDGSGVMIKEDFPNVVYIENDQNLGFGKANNQALSICKGKYILYLNPDTIITKENLEISLNHLINNPQVGALGIKLLDGSGNYHEESKRGFPSIWSAFTKLSGLYKLFSKSKFFNYYYLGHLSAEENQEVDVLCGAFMMARLDLIKSLKGFDEDFFMYGEDIDLCKRIKEEGFQIKYIAESSMIHFKGESSKKLDYKYIKSFYGSMFIYLKKHQNSGLNKILIPLFSVAVFLLAGLNYIYRLFSSLLWIILDFVLLSGALIGMSNFWARWYHHNPDYFSNNLTGVLIIVAVVYVIGQYLYGKYDEHRKYFNILKAILFAGISALLIYSVLPEALRFSRFLFAGSSLLALVIFSLTFFIQRYFNNRNQVPKHNYLIVGNADSSEKIESLLDQSNSKSHFLGFVSPEYSERSLGTISDIQNILKQMNVDQIIFSTKDIKFESILKTMSQNGNQFSYQLASEDNVSILSSHSAKRQGNIITVDVAFLINNSVNKRLKRLFDIFMGILLLILSPLFMLFSGLLRARWSRLLRVIIGSNTMIGFEEEGETLPQIKQAMFNIKDIFPEQFKNRQIDYVKRYNLFLDFEYLFLALLK